MDMQAGTIAEADVTDPVSERGSGRMCAQQRTVKGCLSDTARRVPTQRQEGRVSTTRNPVT